MTEAQFITFTLGFAATIATVLVAILINNSRLTDVKEALRAEVKAGKSEVLQQMAAYQMDIISKIAELDNLSPG
jgi:uncharacterized membrane protein